MKVALASLLFGSGALLECVLAQTPLVSRRFNYTNLPYQADDQDGTRGRQSGYNRCNSTTEGPTSLCQTGYVNSIDDFCIWGLPDPDSLVGNEEGEAVAFCTRPGRGTRIIPPGALTGVQFLRAPGYVQVTGVIKQELVNIKADDSGGEMDPAGADQRGNPLGGLIFSNAFNGDGNIPASDNSTNLRQVIWWTNFMGGSRFCIKACDPDSEDQARMCEHIYDRIGCEYNMPAKYENGTFESCLSDRQMYPGVYVGENGQTSTYTQPPESLGEITSINYRPMTPSSSSCTPYESTQLYSALNAVGGSSSTTTTSSAQPTSTTAVSSSGAPSGSSSPASGTAGRAASTSGNPTATSRPNGAASIAGSTALTALALFAVMTVL